MRPITAGILGAGRIGKIHANNLMAMGGVRLKAIADPYVDFKEWPGGAIATSRNPEDVLKDEEIEAILVCSPTPSHADLTDAAARAGKHVFCEKPIALDLARAERMIAAAGEAGVTFMVAHVLRFWPEYVFLKHAVDQAKFGRLLQLEFERFSSIPNWGSGGWLTDAARSGGPTVDLHIHDADMVIFLLGPPLAVRAELVSAPTCQSVEADYDYGSAGPLVRARGGWILDAGYPFHAAFRAVFERAVIEYDSRLSPTLTIFRPNAKPRTPKMPPHDGYYYQLEQFIHCAARGVEPPTATAANGREALALTLAERKAAKKNIVVRFSG